jgi:hypothetical protein
VRKLVSFDRGDQSVMPVALAIMRVLEYHLDCTLADCQPH